MGVLEAVMSEPNENHPAALEMGRSVFRARHLQPRTPHSPAGPGTGHWFDRYDGA